MKGFKILLLLLFLLPLLKICTSVDTITSDRSIGDGETIVSAGGSFELGFFSLANSSSRYIGIWYKNIDPNKTVVWVANREAPLNDTSGILNITDKGILVLYSSRKDIVWSSNTPGIITENAVGQLLDSGNLVVKDGNENKSLENYSWQSFDYPGDTLLPGMKLGKNLVTGFDWFVSSWKSSINPASGDIKCQLDLHGVPQFFVRKGNITLYRLGSWNGVHLVGAEAMQPNSIFTYVFVWNTKEIYYNSWMKNDSVQTRFVLTPTGMPQRFTWTDNRWVGAYRPIDQCDDYAICGSFSSCNINKFPVCSCLKGFEPVSPSKWKLSDWTDGCARKANLSCNAQGDGFLNLTEVKLPDTSRSWFNKTMGLEECNKKCLEDCSCVAYAALNISSGIGCLMWSDNLTDIKQLSVGDGQDLYIRMVASELDNTDTITKGKKQGVHIKKEGATLIIVFSLVSLLGILVVGWIFYRRKGQLKRKEMMEEMDLPIYDLNTIISATNDFSHNNKLGEGGFGPVYKGELKEKQQIAVKRLSRSSGQGIEEFKNEIKLIAKLQHRNLVKLLGCCIEGDEKMLIYEYMPNKSLDNFIFGEARRINLLDWHTRLNIIIGIGRGLLYLHQDSRLRIIHRDLKASNVLLDKDMNPKISDFGMARMFSGEETGEKTRRVVGTYGYMPPEYAVDGVFSVKSDVFSFGVLVLEIVSGKRNREFFHPDHSHNLLGHAWKLWMGERPLDFIDDTDGVYGVSSDSRKVLRCIHVGLLCVQQQPDDRPNMSYVVLMLGSDMPLPEPKQPAYFYERNLSNAASPAGNTESPSTNEFTVTLLEARDDPMNLMTPLCEEELEGIKQ